MPTQAQESITTYLITQGILGIAVLVLAVVAWVLYSRNQKLNDALVELAKSNGQELITFYQKDAEVEAKKAEAITGMAHSIDLLTAKINKEAA